MHPEKVLVVRNSFASGRPDEHERMVAALLEACQFCDQPKNRPFLVNMLSHPRYANAPEEALSAALIGPFIIRNKETRQLDLSIFHQQNANDPTDEKAEWILRQLYRSLDGNGERPGVLQC
jgi:ABC-type nitrate/sulfonate/bicarbonate transport system substrate-binding protein